jgi:hypothetical protein
MAASTFGQVLEARAWPWMLGSDIDQRQLAPVR